MIPNTVCRLALLLQNPVALLGLAYINNHCSNSRTAEKDGEQFLQREINRLHPSLLNSFFFLAGKLLATFSNLFFALANKYKIQYFPEVRQQGTFFIYLFLLDCSKLTKLNLTFQFACLKSCSTNRGLISRRWAGIVQLSFVVRRFIHVYTGLKENGTAGLSPPFLSCLTSGPSEKSGHCPVDSRVGKSEWIPL